MQALLCSAAAAALLLAVLLVPEAHACNGFRLVVKKAETKCADGTPSLITMKDFGLTLTPDCKFVPQGCVKVNQKFDKAIVNYVIKTNTGVPLVEGSKNACEAMDEATKYPDAVVVMDMFQLPKKCPVEPMEKCADGKVIDIANFKDKLVPGSIRAEVKIEHENGMMSCVAFEGALKK